MEKKGKIREKTTENGQGGKNTCGGKHFYWTACYLVFFKKWFGGRTSQKKRAQPLAQSDILKKAKIL